MVDDDEPPVSRARPAIVPPPVPESEWDERETFVPATSRNETIPAPPPSGEAPESATSTLITLRSPPPDAPSPSTFPTMDPPPPAASAIRELGKGDEAPSSERKPAAR